MLYYDVRTITRETDLRNKSLFKSLVRCPSIRQQYEKEKKSESLLLL